MSIFVKCAELILNQYMRLQNYAWMKDPFQMHFNIIQNEKVHQNGFRLHMATNI